MNAHLVQSPLAQAEARYLMGAELQYVSGTDGGVLRGLIQDHVDGMYNEAMIYLYFYISAHNKVDSSRCKVNAPINISYKGTISAICLCSFVRRPWR